jgi:hypothetical protein
MPDSNGFNEHKMHINKELERLSEVVEKLSDAVHEQSENNIRAHGRIEARLSSQDTKMKMWSGGIAIVIAGVVSLIVRILV